MKHCKYFLKYTVKIEYQVIFIKYYYFCYNFGSLLSLIPLEKEALLRL